MATSRTSDLCLNPSGISFSSIENGGYHSKLGEIMSILVLGKYTHPTRFRQIVETQSLNELTSEEHRILSKDQKHSSTVAKVHYQKQRSREVALKGYECLQKLQGAKGQRWTRMSTQDSEIQLPTPGLQLNFAKYQFLPPK